MRLAPLSTSPTYPWLSFDHDYDTCYHFSPFQVTQPGHYSTFRKHSFLSPNIVTPSPHPPQSSFPTPSFLPTTFHPFCLPLRSTTSLNTIPSSSRFYISSSISSSCSLRSHFLPPKTFLHLPQYLFLLFLQPLPSPSQILFKSRHSSLYHFPGAYSSFLCQLYVSCLKLYPQPKSSVTPCTFFVK